MKTRRVSISFIIDTEETDEQIKNRMEENAIHLNEQMWLLDVQVETES